MKFNETHIFIFIAALVLGLLISLNFHFDGSAAGVVMTAQQYQEAYITRDKLQKEISTLRSSYYDNLSKLNEYRDEDSTISKVLQDVAIELERNNLILGTSDVVGEGIRIKIEDASNDFSGTIDPEYINSRIIHDDDILIIMKILRNAGAKAIAINGLRVISTSEFICAGAFIMVDGAKHPAPYYIDVIGSRESLLHYINKEENYFKVLRDLREIRVSVTETSELKLPAYIGSIEYKYMSPK